MQDYIFLQKAWFKTTNSNSSEPKTEPDQEQHCHLSSPIDDINTDSDRDL
jgi:hypothetical protein